MYLNVDVGEEIKANLEIEKIVMPYIHTANISCNSSAEIIRKCMLLAVDNEVAVGALLSVADHKNTEQKISDIPAADLKKNIAKSIGSIF